MNLRCTKRWTSTASAVPENVTTCELGAFWESAVVNSIRGRRCPLRAAMVRQNNLNCRETDGYTSKKWVEQLRMNKQQILTINKHLGASLVPASVIWRLTTFLSFSIICKNISGFLTVCWEINRTFSSTLRNYNEFSRWTMKNNCHNSWTDQLIVCFFSDTLNQNDEINIHGLMMSWSSVGLWEWKSSRSRWKTCSQPR